MRISRMIRLASEQWYQFTVGGWPYAAPSGIPVRHGDPCFKTIKEALDWMNKNDHKMPPGFKYELSGAKSSFGHGNTRHLLKNDDVTTSRGIRINEYAKPFGADHTPNGYPAVKDK